MIGDNAREAILNFRKITFATSASINLKGCALHTYEGPESNPDVVLTQGLYYVKYSTTTRRGEKAKIPFIVKYDFLNERMRVAGYKDLVKASETNEIAAFMIKYTNLNEEMFEIARQNEEMHIPFCLDIVKWNELMREQLGEPNKKKYAMVLNPNKPYLLNTEEAEVNNYNAYKESKK